MTKKDLVNMIPVIIFILTIFTGMSAFIIRSYSNRMDFISEDLKMFKNHVHSNFVRYEQYNKDGIELSARINSLSNRLYNEASK